MKISYLDNYKTKALETGKKEFNIHNDLAIPKIVKVSINSGVGRLATGEGGSADAIKSITEMITRLAGQKAKANKAKKSIAGFKLREGTIVGISVTLRGKKMADFIDRFINITLPRTRDFWGIDQKHFDDNGNLTIGMKEMTAFPELSHDIIKIPFGVEITFVTNTHSKEKSVRLFELLGFPLKPITTKKN